jgi:hypothetical protein
MGLTHDSAPLKKREKKCLDKLCAITRKNERLLNLFKDMELQLTVNPKQPTRFPLANSGKYWRFMLSLP